MNYKDCVKVCKRVNNTKRNYLVLNKAQCKHFPSSPKLALTMFNDLAKTISEYENDEHTLVVGFAETATAIGAGVASNLSVDYVTTTRESFNAEFIEFTESHSHATEQKLIKPDLDWYSHIIFVEDEVTTGNTILKIVNKMLELNPNLKFSVASILNGMTSEQENTYKNMNIDVHYLVKLDNSDFSDRANNIDLDGKSFNCKSVPDNLITIGVENPRRVLDIDLYDSDISDVFKDLVFDSSDNILVLGTEECMYPAIKIGAYLEDNGCNVKCHSTTRSPIGVSSDDDYPLNASFKLHSCYDYDRATFIYNLDKYDRVFIVSDASCDNKGFKDLILALRFFGNDNITQIYLKEY